MSPRTMILTVALLASVVCARAAASGFFVPTAGPLGRNAVDIALSPNGDLFATTDDQSVSRFTSASSRWTNLPPLPAPVSAVEVAPDGQVWAFGAGDQFVSSDHGQTWTRPGSLPAILQVAFDASRQVFAATGAGLYRSADRGRTWTLLGLPQAAIEAVEVAANGTVWAAVASGLYHSGDAGATWAQVAALPLPATALAAHPEGGAYVGLASLGYPTCQWGGLYRAHENGELSLLGFATQRVNDILVGDDASTTISVDTSCHYAMSCPGCGFPGVPSCAAQGIYQSADGGATWSQRQLSTESIPRELVLRHDGTLFTVTVGFGCDICGTISRGILSSADGGTAWSALPVGPGKSTASAIWVDTPPGTPTIFAAGPHSVYASTTHGMDWLLLADVTPTICAQVLGASVFARDASGIVFAFDGWNRAFAVGPGGVLSGSAPSCGYDALHAATVVTANGALLVACLDGVHAAPAAAAGVFDWSAGVGPRDLRFLEAGPSLRVVGSGSPYDSGTYLSDDGGSGWTQIATVGGGPLVFAPDGRMLYVASQSGGAEVRVVRLVDAGGTWIESPLPAFGPGIWWVQDLLLDPTGTLYALSDTGVGGHVLRLKADRWEDLGEIPDARSFSIADDGYLYIGTYNGVWRSSGSLGQVTAIWPGTEGLTSVRAFPNPFAARTSITFALTRPDRVHLTVYDVRGRLVSKLLRGSGLERGAQEAIWEPPAGLPNGVYIYCLRTSLGEHSGRLLLLR